MSKLGFLKNKVFSNSMWLIAEKILSIFGLFFVTSMVAKYIGPDNYGKLVFASSLFAVIQTISMFGSENLFFQKISKNKTLGEKLIFATKRYRTLIYTVGSIFLLLYLYFTTDYLTFTYSIATCIALYFALHDMPYIIYFDALLKSKINVVCNMFGLIFTLLFRYLLVFFELDIIWLIIPIISVTLIPYVIRLNLYKRFKATEFLQLNELSKYQKYMLGAGKKLFLYSLAVIIYTRTAQIFLGIKSQFDLGIYTVAITLGMSFAFVLNAIITSYMTQIYAEKDKQKSQDMTSVLYGITCFVSLGAILFLYIAGPYIVSILYGNNYTQVNSILTVITFACLLSTISGISDKYLVKENAYNYLSKKTNLLVVFNLVTAASLITVFGLKGAVMSIFLTEFVSATLCNYFFKHGEIFKVQLKTFSPTLYMKYFK